MVILMSGLDYSLAPIELRERLSFSRSQAGELSARIRVMAQGVEGCVLLSTCNRTEIYLSCRTERGWKPDELLCRAAGLPYAPFAGAFVTRWGEDCARHLLEVAGGLRSQLWGEDQILAQVKSAILLSRENGAADPVLETLFRTAVAGGKEIKTGIRLTGVPVSAAARAVEVLERDLGSLAGKRALVIGNGEMGRLSASLLRDAGCRVTVTLRTYRHGETVVPAGCGVVPYEERLLAAETADIILSATASPHYTFWGTQLGGLSSRPRHVVDLALPRDIDPETEKVEGITLYNVDTLGAQLHVGKIPEEARVILERQLSRFYEWDSYRTCLPVIEELKEVITRRVLASPVEDELDREELAELAVRRTVDLLTGGLKECLSKQDLERVTGKIRTHTAGVRRAKEGGHEKSDMVSAVC